jgi:hypothetical protein
MGELVMKRLLPFRIDWPELNESGSAHNVNFFTPLPPIILFANIDVSITKICLDTSVLAKSNMDRRE